MAKVQCNNDSQDAVASGGKGEGGGKHPGQSTLVAHGLRNEEKGKGKAQGRAARVAALLTCDTTAMEWWKMDA